MRPPTVNVNLNARMWAEARRDGRPAEYRWRPLFNAAVWLMPTDGVPCSNAAKTRNPYQSQPLVKVHHIVRTSGGDIAA